VSRPVLGPRVRAADRTARVMLRRVLPSGVAGRC
jgi:hypothetical protein